MSNKFEELLTQVGTGKWNFIYFFAVCYWYFLLAPHYFSGVYLTPNMNHTCIPPDLDRPVEIASDSCSYFVNDSSTGKVQEFTCTNFEYDTSVYKSTLTSEFHLVCDKTYLRATYQSTYMSAAIFTSVVAGYIADKFGRKNVFVGSFLFFASLAFSISFLNNISMILICRFIMGCVVLPTMYILSLEVCEIKYREVVGIATGLPFSFGTIAWGGMAYAVRDWRWLQIYATLPFVLLFPALILMDESPRWLIVRGDYEEAIKILQKAARWNKTQLPSTDALQKLMIDINDELNHPEKYVLSERGSRGWTSWELPTIFKTRSIRIIVCIFSLNLFISALVFCGLGLSGSKYSTDPFLYIVLGGIMDMPSYTVTIPLVSRVGRKWPTICGFTISGIVILLLAFIPENLSGLVMTLAMLGKLTNGCAYTIIYMCMLEVLPTEVRVQGVGITSMTSGLGATIAPYITDYLGPFVPWAPSVIFGVASLVAAVAMLPVPETLGKPLPDTIHDLEDIILVPRFLRKSTKGTSDEVEKLL